MSTSITREEQHSSPSLHLVGESKLGRKSINLNRDFIKREIKVLTILLSSYDHNPGVQNQLSVAFIMTILRVLQVPLATKPSAQYSIADALMQSRLARKNLPKKMSQYLSDDSKIQTVTCDEDLGQAEFKGAWDPKVSLHQLNNRCVLQRLYNEWNIRDGWFGGLVDPDSLPSDEQMALKMAELQVRQSIYSHFYHGYLPFVLQRGILGGGTPAAGGHQHHHQLHHYLPSPPLWDEWNTTGAGVTTATVRNPDLYWVDAIKGMIDGDQMDLCALFLTDKRIQGISAKEIGAERARYTATFGGDAPFCLPTPTPDYCSRLLSKRTAEVLTGPIERKEEFFMSNLPVIESSCKSRSSYYQYDVTSGEYEYFRDPKSGLRVQVDPFEKELQRQNCAQRPGKMSWGLPWLNFLRSPECVYACHHAPDQDPLFCRQEDDTTSSEEEAAPKQRKRFSLVNQRCGSCLFTKRIYDWCCAGGASDPFGERKPAIFTSCRELTKRELILCSLLSSLTTATGNEKSSAPNWILPALLQRGLIDSTIPGHIDGLLARLVASGDLTMLRNLLPFIRKMDMDLASNTFPWAYQISIQPDMGEYEHDGARASLLELAVLFFQPDSIRWLLFEADVYNSYRTTSRRSDSINVIVKELDAKLEYLFKRIVLKTMAMGKQIAEGTGKFKYSESLKKSGSVFLLPQVPYDKPPVTLHAKVKEMEQLWEEFKATVLAKESST